MEHNFGINIKGIPTKELNFYLTMFKEQSNLISEIKLVLWNWKSLDFPSALLYFLSLLCFGYNK